MESKCPGDEQLADVGGAVARDGDGEAIADDRIRSPDRRSMRRTWRGAISQLRWQRRTRAPSWSSSALSEGSTRLVGAVSGQDRFVFERIPPR